MIIRYKLAYELSSLGSTLAIRILLKFNIKLRFIWARLAISTLSKLFSIADDSSPRGSEQHHVYPGVRTAHRWLGPESRDPVTTIGVHQV